jgi:hypothetical protein
MDTEEKSEASWEELEQLGPYQLREQVPQDEHSHGELYRALHETSGATALVLKPTPESEARSVPLTDWQVRCVSSASPSYLALEVEHSAWSVAPDRHSMEALMCLFEEVRDAVKRMDRAFPASTESHLWWHLGLALAGAAAVCALLFALMPLWPMSRPPGNPESLASPQAEVMSHNLQGTAEKPAPFANGWLADATPQEQPALARPLPGEPFKGQKRPPCTRYVQVELVGACWMPHRLKAPCPDELYEYQGECYAPVFASKPPPQSLGQ